MDEEYEPQESIFDLTFVETCHSNLNSTFLNQFVENKIEEEED